MSKMGNILLDIEERVVNSARIDYEALAKEYGVTPRWIKDVADRLQHVESDDYSPYGTCNS